MCQLNIEYQIHLEMCELFVEKKICQIEIFRRNALEAKKKSQLSIQDSLI